MVFNLGDSKFLQDEIQNNRNYIPTLQRSPYIFFYEIFESNKLLCVPYYVNETMNYGFYDKDSGKAYNFTQERVQKDLNIGAFSSPIGVIDDEYFISLLRPGLLKEMQQKGQKFDERLVGLLQESGEEDNPILLIFRRK